MSTLSNYSPASYSPADPATTIIHDTSIDAAEEQFCRLLSLAELDRHIDADPSLVAGFELALDGALRDAYDGIEGDAAAHLFVQRVLYRINRLKLFWYDDLRNYENERSIYLRRVRERIERSWQEWELGYIDHEALRGIDVRQALLDRTADDLDPAISADGHYFRDVVGERGYRKLLEIASLDGLVEASQLSRTLGGPGNDVHAVLTRLLVEEYGFGRLERKHSSFFRTMLVELGMRVDPEAYFDAVPWEVLAAINHSFLLSERKRHFLRYVGGLLHTEISVPAAFTPYRQAAERLGMSAAAMAYWDLHIKVDVAHGRWMLDDVALPLIERYPGDAWELVLGYDQQRFMGGRAGAAIARAAREAEFG